MELSIHETCYTKQGAKKNGVCRRDGIIIIPTAQVKKVVSEPLEMAVEENPECDRDILPGKGMYNGQWQKCIDTLKGTLICNRWKEEMRAMRWMAKSYELGDVKECYGWYFRAIAEAGASLILNVKLPIFWRTGDGLLYG